MRYIGSARVILGDKWSGSALSFSWPLAVLVIEEDQFMLRGVGPLRHLMHEVFPRDKVEYIAGSHLFGLKINPRTGKKCTFWSPRWKKIQERLGQDGYPLR